MKRRQVVLISRLDKDGKQKVLYRLTQNYTNRKSVSVMH